MKMRTLAILVCTFSACFCYALDVPWKTTGSPPVNVHWAGHPVDGTCCLTIPVTVYGETSYSEWGGNSQSFTEECGWAASSVSAASAGYIAFGLNATTCYADGNGIEAFGLDTAYGDSNPETLGETYRSWDPEGRLSNVSINLYLGAGVFNGEAGPIYLKRVLLHEFGHAVGMDHGDAAHSSAVMMEYANEGSMVWSNTEVSSITEIYTASSQACTGGPGPVFLQSVEFADGESPGTTLMSIRTELEYEVSGIRINYAADSLQPDSLFTCLGTIALVHPNHGGYYEFQHDVSYPPGGAYLLEALDALGSVQHRLLFDAAEPPLTVTEASTVDALRASNLARIRRPYWQQVATGERSVGSIDGDGASCEYLVLAYEDFVQDIAPICDYWEFMGGIDVELVSIDGALHTPAMIRDYIANCTGGLKSIWLVGAPAHPDPIYGEICLVPTDDQLLDYYYADAGDFGAMEYAVGRLPAKNRSEVVFYVDKELRYHWDTSWGGRKPPEDFSRLLVITVPDDGDFPNPATWNSDQWAVVSNAEALGDHLQGLTYATNWDTGFLDITALDGYDEGIRAAQSALSNALHTRMVAGQHVVFGLTEHNSSGFQFSVIPSFYWLSATTTPVAGHQYWRPCQTFWITPNCGAASVYCNPLTNDGRIATTIPSAELFSTEGLLIFGSMAASWNRVIGDIMPLLTSRILVTDPATQRPMSIGEAWRATYNEVLSGSTTYPNGLSDFGILGDPMLYIREPYDSAAAVSGEPTEFLDIVATPSPANGRVQLHLSGLRVGGGKVDICDVRGMRVQSLPVEHAASGTLVLEWNGEDLTGRSVASGVYFARVENAGVAVACRIVYLK